MMCDIALPRTTAKFCQPGITLGHPRQRSGPRRMKPAQSAVEVAMDLCLTGRMMDSGGKPIGSGSCRRVVLPTS